MVFGTFGCSKLDLKENKNLYLYTGNNTFRNTYFTFEPNSKFYFRHQTRGSDDYNGYKEFKGEYRIINSDSITFDADSFRINTKYVPDLESYNKPQFKAKRTSDNVVLIPRQKELNEFQDSISKAIILLEQIKRNYHKMNPNLTWIAITKKDRELNNEFNFLSTKY